MFCILLDVTLIASRVERTYNELFHISLPVHIGQVWHHMHHHFEASILGHTERLADSFHGVAPTNRNYVSYHILNWIILFLESSQSNWTIKKIQVSFLCCGRCQIVQWHSGKSVARNYNYMHFFMMRGFRWPVNPHWHSKVRTMEDKIWLRSRPNTNSLVCEFKCNVLWSACASMQCRSDFNPIGSEKIHKSKYKRYKMIVMNGNMQNVQNF